MAEKQVPFERRLIREWLAKEFPNEMPYYNIQIGPLPEVPEAAYLKSGRRRADGIVVTQDIVYIIETKRRARPETIAQLEDYARLFKLTQEFSKHWEKPIKLIILTVLSNQSTEDLSFSKNIRYVLFAPQWALDRLQEQLESEE